MLTKICFLQSKIAIENIQHFIETSLLAASQSGTFSEILESKKRWQKLADMAIHTIKFYYFKILAFLYFIGTILHSADVLDVRLKFSEMNTLWKFWIIYLLIADSVTAVGLWKLKSWGIVGFLTVAISQLIAYTFFTDFLEPAYFWFSFTP